MLLNQKTSSLTPVNPKPITWFELKHLDMTWVDWRWVNGKLSVLVYEVGWVECEYPFTESNEEELRFQLEQNWIAAHYADFAYFDVNQGCKGKLDA